MTSRNSIRFFSINLLVAFICGLAFACPEPAHAEQAQVPKLSAPISDLTGTLSATQIQALTALVTALEQKKGSQVAILIIGTTAGEAIESYSLRVVEANKLGRLKINDGVLFLIAKDDHAARIEVGYGLEGAIPDVIAKRILEEQVIPLFRTGDFYAGIAAGVEAIAARVRGEELPAPKTNPSDRHSNGGGMFIFAFIFFLSIASVLKSAFGDLGGSLVGGLLGAIVGYFIAGTIIAGILLIIGFFLTLFSNAVPLGMGRGGMGGGFGGGSSGGWSGGGGSFGGGGASSRW